MVRFIMEVIRNIFYRSSKIYIPIWLDLLSKFDTPKGWRRYNLHSNMVRFIMRHARNNISRKY